MDPGSVHKSLKHSKKRGGFKWGLNSLPRIKPRLCRRRRIEAPKTLARRDVGAILCRRHIYKYVEKQNREASVAARIFKPQ